MSIGPLTHRLDEHGRYLVVMVNHDGDYYTEGWHEGTPLRIWRKELVAAWRSSRWIWRELGLSHCYHTFDEQMRPFDSLDHERELSLRESLGRMNYVLSKGHWPEEPEDDVFVGCVIFMLGYAIPGVALRATSGAMLALLPEADVKDAVDWLMNLEQKP